MITYWTVLTLMYGIQNNMYTQHLVVESPQDCLDIIDGGLHDVLTDKYGAILATCKPTSTMSYYPKPQLRPTVGE